jgi:uncharacterized protein YndB with AHSA1/START domain
MTERSVSHGAFTIERVYKASPARAFAAWATKAAKAAWFACHDEWVVSEHELDFRAGGSERLTTGPAGEPHTFDARYSEVIADARIVYAYDMWVAGTLISVSVATVEFHPHGSGTRMVFTEQGAFLDGHTTVEEREEGTRLGFANLDRAIDG